MKFGNNSAETQPLLCNRASLLISVYSTFRIILRQSRNFESYSTPRSGCHQTLQYHIMEAN